MKTITIDNKTIEISDESYEAFKKQFVKDSIREPEDGDEYWFIDPYGDAEASYWGGTTTDAFCASIGNCFQSEEEAEEALKTGWVAYLQALKRLKDYIAENGLEFEPDWSSYEDKWAVFFDHNKAAFGYDCYGVLQFSNLPYYKTEDDALQVIRDCEPELKILFGVK